MWLHWRSTSQSCEISFCWANTYVRGNSFQLMRNKLFFALSILSRKLSGYSHKRLVYTPFCHHNVILSNAHFHMGCRQQNQLWILPTATIKLLLRYKCLIAVNTCLVVFWLVTTFDSSGSSHIQGHTVSQASNRVTNLILLCQTVLCSVKGIISSLHEEKS